MNNKSHHWKKRLKHPLCYNIITGSDADFELVDYSVALCAESTTFCIVLLTFVLLQVALCAESLAL